jgi:hypothetical protein
LEKANFEKPGDHNKFKEGSRVETRRFQAEGAFKLKPGAFKLENQALPSLQPGAF